MKTNPVYQMGDQSWSHESTRSEKMLAGVLFLTLVPIIAHFLFSWMGMNPTDDGFFLGMGGAFWTVKFRIGILSPLVRRARGFCGCPSFFWAGITPSGFRVSSYGFNSPALRGFGPWSSIEC